MSYETIPIQIDLGRLESHSPIDVSRDDDLHYRFVRDTGSGSITAVVELKYAMASGDMPFSESSATELTLDGTLNTIDIEDKPFIVPVVTTAQSGFSGTLYLFTRPRSARA